MTSRTYGEIRGYPVGSTFLKRAELAASKVHRPLQGGICGGKDGAESIVVSGGYGVFETATGRQVGRLRMAAAHGIVFGHLAYRASLCS